MRPLPGALIRNLQVSVL